MVVKVNGTTSKPRIVLGGVPQGSILGVYLFNATIDSFEASSKDVQKYGIIGGNPNLQELPSHDGSLDKPLPQVYDRPGFKAWADSPLIVLKYVDDNIIHEKYCFDIHVIDEAGKKAVRAVRSQNLFRQIVRIAEGRGMRVNSAKTVVLVISDSRTYEAAAYIEDAEGSLIHSVKNMKVLGVHFSAKPDMSAQVQSICSKIRSRIWYLRHLYHNGFNQDELLAVYKSTILPCHDYCSSVYHSSLTLSQTIQLERLQSKALKAIYGYDPSYRELMEKAHLITLRARRDDREIKFAKKCLTPSRFLHWFPAREGDRTRRDQAPYKEEFARGCKCYNSPIYNMRRRLNKEARNGSGEGAREDRGAEA